MFYVRDPSRKGNFKKKAMFIDDKTAIPQRWK